MAPEKNQVVVSVVIPVYNVEKFLSETIESVLNQTLTDFELILINDGSIDRSPEICEEYKKRDSRIKYFSQKNAGVSVARNLGLSHAKGEYVFFMDSDDTIDQLFIETSYECAKEQNSDFIIVGNHYCRMLPNVSALPTCAQFVRIEFLRKYQDIRFPENIQPCEDGLFSHRLIALTDRIGTNRHGLYYYRSHENQNNLKINENTEKIIQQIPIWLEILKSFYAKYDLYKTHASHLALFVEHEPFGLRYLNAPFTEEQKQRLFNIIRNFVDEYVIPHLRKEDYAKLSLPFMHFIHSGSSFEFNEKYRKYLKNKILNRKIRLLFARLIPFSKIRRELRKEINVKYS